MEAIDHLKHSPYMKVWVVSKTQNYSYWDILKQKSGIYIHPEIWNILKALYIF